MNETGILPVVTRKLAPFVLLFGLYLVTYGHQTPGGGFQGGVVIASGVILLMLGQRPEAVDRRIKLRRFTLIESLALLVFLTAGAAGALVGGSFLTVIGPTGTSGAVHDAAFILVLNVVIGLKVGAGVTVICYHLFAEE